MVVSRPLVRIATVAANQTWPLRHSVMWPDKPLEYVQLAEDEVPSGVVHFGLFVADELEPCSVCSLFFQQPREAQFRKLCTEQARQGRGYGTALLQHVFDYAASSSVDRIWCNARNDKASFYQRSFGMKTAANSRFERGGLEYVVMEKDLSPQR